MGRRVGLLSPGFVSFGAICLYVVLHENVCGFDIEALAFLLKDLYACEYVELDPRFFGWPVARRRRYTLFTLIGKASLARPLSEMRSILAYDVGEGSALDFFTATAEACTLTASQEYLKRYIEIGKCSVKHAVVDLAQNALLRQRNHCVDGALCTLTCSSSKMYATHLKRFLLPQEALLAQGYPVMSWAARASGCVHRSLDHQAASALDKLAGNAMHAACVGAVMAWAAGFVSLFAEPYPHDELPLSEPVPAVLPSQGSRHIAVDNTDQPDEPPPDATSNAGSVDLEAAFGSDSDSDDGGPALGCTGDPCVTLGSDSAAYGLLERLSGFCQSSTSGVVAVGGPLLRRLIFESGATCFHCFGFIVIASRQCRTCA